MVGEVPMPNARIETMLWEQAPSITVRLRRNTSGKIETRLVQLRAITDGRTLSIMARWYDTTETIQKRSWVWDEAASEYVLEVYPVDMIAIQWPLTGSGSFNMLDGQAASYDVWRWQAGWNNASGYGDDLSLRLSPHPLGTNPSEIEGHLYEDIGHDSLVEVLWKNDDGVPGLAETTRPNNRIHSRMFGSRILMASGSAADVKAIGLYNPGKERSKSTYFVEFYRTLTTADADADYQIVGPGPHPFAIALTDQTAPIDHFTSGKILLYVDQVQN
jgi:hypothetical protein